MVAKRRSLDARPDVTDEPSQLGRRLVGRESQALALQDQAVDDGAQVLPAEGRTDGRAGRRVEDDRRRALVRDAHDVGAAGVVQRARRRARPRSAISSASSSTSPGSGVAIVSAAGGVSVTVPSGRRGRAHRARADVDDERSHHGSPPSPSTPGFRRSSGRARASVPRARRTRCAERVGDEAGAVATDAVVVAERAARGEHLVGRAVPRPR